MFNLCLFVITFDFFHYIYIESSVNVLVGKSSFLSQFDVEN